MRVGSALLLSITLLLSALAQPAIAKQAKPNCTPWSVDEAVLTPNLVFIGTPDEIEAGGIVLFKDPSYLKGVEPKRARVRFPTKNLPKLGQTITVPAFGTFETGYVTTACALAQFSETSPSFKDIFTRLSTYRYTFMDKMQSTGPNLSLLLPMRDTATYAFKNRAGEIAARLFTLAEEISKNERVDVLSTGNALLSINSNKDALSHFDDLLEKDGQDKEAWQGRYLALAQMNRWGELPAQLPTLQNITLQDVALPTELNLTNADLTHGFWRSVIANTLQADNASFEGSLIVESSFKSAHLAKTNFNNSYLRNVDFTGADLTGATFNGADLRGIIWPKNYTPPVPEK